MRFTQSVSVFVCSMLLSAVADTVTEHRWIDEIRLCGCASNVNNDSAFAV